MDEKLVPNSTQIPNFILDFIIPNITEAEVKCLLYICRRTYGFHKERDRISLSQFVNGIKTKEGKELDCGSGVSRPAVVEALKNFIGAGLVEVIKTNRGNFYKINTENIDLNEVVKKVNQLRKLTRSGKEGLPKQVKLLNLQKKGKKEKESIALIDLFNKEIQISENDHNRTLLLQEKGKFLSYWTEKSPNGKKERWQMERVFDIKRRWDTWLTNLSNWTKPKEYKKPEIRTSGGAAKIGDLIKSRQT